MTPRTTARPTIVRTMLPPLLALCAALAACRRRRTEVQLGVLTVGREGDRGGEQAAEDGRGKNGVEGPHAIPRGEPEEARV